MKPTVQTGESPGPPHLTRVLTFRSMQWPSVMMGITHVR
ncbi:hypothetical protein A6R68_19654 [Neotoma lepida]|uniref:Uncharacterized protein n=1 Tax=Neotoma lepida TaxID=56216 RepID=A0A1A6HI61_NEOLE|nr:hypothetical protein A6R68_19654 [Neotoma lepida]